MNIILHIDIDGTDPLGVVSGTVVQGLDLLRSPGDFIGRVTANTSTDGIRHLVVEEIEAVEEPASPMAAPFRWPQSTLTINRLEIAIESGFNTLGRVADVTFIDTAWNVRRGPYRLTQKSIYFREVEVDVDIEDDAVVIGPYNTLTHPADLTEENLTLEKAYAKAGIMITRSRGSGSIIASAAGADAPWTDSELHDSMETHWTDFANRPQWKMWIFQAEQYAVPNRTGRSGQNNGRNHVRCLYRRAIRRRPTGNGDFYAQPALSYGSRCIHRGQPTYGRGSPARGCFFNLMHESGHAFNLLHSWQKGWSPWDAPTWMPLTADALALSWMISEFANSPDGDNATWFYNRFRFRFDDDELLFMRHAPPGFVQMGGEEWSTNHARVSRESLDRRLELVLRSRKPVLELGEPVFAELRLRNVSANPVTAYAQLDPRDGIVEIAVTNTRGERRPFIPIARYRALRRQRTLEPGEALYGAVNLTIGRFGFPFKEPGFYRIEASYPRHEGGSAAAVMHLYVRPPDNEDIFVVKELFNARVGRALYFQGTRVMDDVNAKLDWVRQQLGSKHPVSHYLTAARLLPSTKPFKVVDAVHTKLRLFQRRVRSRRARTRAIDRAGGCGVQLGRPHYLSPNCRRLHAGGSGYRQSREGRARSKCHP